MLELARAFVRFDKVSQGCPNHTEIVKGCGFRRAIQFRQDGSQFPLRLGVATSLEEALRPLLIVGSIGSLRPERSGNPQTNRYVSHNTSLGSDG